jgi:hypothetical protein
MGSELALTEVAALHIGGKPAGVFDGLVAHR